MVPGAVILSEILAVIAQEGNHGVVCTGLPRVKFLSPLKPGEVFDLRWEEFSDGVIAFTCTAGERPLALGRLTVRREPR